MDAASQPLVSLVTPSFNQGRFLRRTIESVLRQDYPHLEYLVVDGGSSDDSIAILKSYGERFSWTSEPDRGQTDAINKGLGRARGEILAYLNSDDVLLPGAVRSIVRQFQRRPEVDVLYGHAFWIDEDDRFLGCYTTADFDGATLVENCVLCQPATFWRRRVHEKFGLFDDNLHFAMDYDYWLRLARGGARFGRLTEFLAGTRLHSAAKTVAQRTRVYQEIFQVCRRYFGRAGFGHYLAYWEHRLHERPRGWPALIRRLPHARWWLAFLHSRWHAGESSLGGFGRLMLEGIGRRLRRALSAADEVVER